MTILPPLPLYPLTSPFPISSIPSTSSVTATVATATTTTFPPFSLSSSSSSSSSVPSLLSGYDPDMLLLPFGLVLLFFGTFILRFVLTGCLLIICGIPCATLSAICMYLCEELTGVVLGACIALTMDYYIISKSQPFLVLIFAMAFGAVYLLAPRETSIIVTSYGGASIMFYGMSLVDGTVFTKLNAVQTLLHFDLVSTFKHFTATDVTFSVLSLLIIGLLGCAVQLMLVASTSQSHSQRVTARRTNYVPIP